jgi:Flp pilus assembly protein TadB
MTIQERLRMLRDSASRANAGKHERRPPQRSPGRQPSRPVLWSLLVLTGAAMFVNLLAVFNGNIFAAVFAGWAGLIVVRIWRALGALGALGGDR